MTPTPPDPLRGYPIDHLGVAVTDLEAASLAYDTLGLPRDGEDETLAAQGVRVRAYRMGGSLLELLEPLSDTGPIARFIAKRGPGLHHVALRVMHLETELARLTAENAPFLNDTPQTGRAGSRVVFIHPRWTGGVLLELVEHPTPPSPR